MFGFVFSLPTYVRIGVAVASIFPFLSNWMGFDVIKGIWWPFSQSFATLAALYGAVYTQRIWIGRAKKDMKDCMRRYLFRAVVCALIVMVFHFVPENWGPSNLVMYLTWLIVAVSYITGMFHIVGIIVLASMLSPKGPATRQEP